MQKNKLNIFNSACGGNPVLYPKGTPTYIVTFWVKNISIRHVYIRAINYRKDD
jgi:hypothetical protein